jgi:hypothetical protein
MANVLTSRARRRWGQKIGENTYEVSHYRYAPDDFRCCFCARTTAAATAWVVQPVHGKSVANFFLKTCLSVVADPANVERIASENKWTQLPRPPARSGDKIPPTAWRTGEFIVTTWAPGNGDALACVIGILPAWKVSLKEFVDTVSASLELKHFKGDTTNPRIHRETYEIVGTKRRLLLSSNPEDSTITTASIYTVNAAP